MSKKKSASGKARPAAEKAASARSKSKSAKAAKRKARPSSKVGSKRAPAKKSLPTGKAKKSAAEKAPAKGASARTTSRATRRVTPKGAKANPAAKAKASRPANRLKDKKFVREVEEVLRQKLAELDGRIREKIEEHMKFHENRSNDPTDVASESVDDEMALQVAEVETRERIQIREAFEKVAAGTYGTCERCSARIPIARLKALPSASMCLRCKSLEEEFGPGFFEDNDDLDGDEDEDESQD